MVERKFRDIDRKMKILELRDKRNGKTPPKEGSEEYNHRLKRVLNGEGKDRLLEEMLFNVDRKTKMSGKEIWETRRMNEHEFIAPPELMETAKTMRELLGEEVAETMNVKEV